MNGIETGVLISLALYFLLMIAIGVWAYFKADNDSAGYMLGGRNLSPGVAALSAGASDMSGWLLLGLQVICTALVWSVFGLP